MLARIALLCLPVLCYSTCNNPKAPDGVWRDGCIVKSCKSGALEERLADECVHLIEKKVDEILVEKLAEKGLECSTENETSVVEDDRDFLFIGPTYGTLGMSRVLHLPSFTIANCSPPAFPHGKYGDFVGKLTPEGPLLCGGNINWVKQKACYLLTWSGNWEEVQGMNMKRKGAAAVEIDGGWWVTGGYKRTDTELWDGKTWEPHHDLPVPMSSHCVVKINATTVFFVANIGGMKQIPAAYFYSPATGFVKTEAPGPRNAFACGLHKDYVVIAGGNSATPGASYVSSEFFSLDTLTWHVGPSVEHEYKKYISKGEWQEKKHMYNFNGEIFNWKGHTYWIGETTIWELLGEFGSWQWTKVKEMEVGMGQSEIFLMTAQECSGWK